MRIVSKECLSSTCTQTQSKQGLGSNSMVQPNEYSEARVVKGLGLESSYPQRLESELGKEGRTLTLFNISKKVNKNTQKTT